MDHGLRTPTEIQENADRLSDASQAVAGDAPPSAAARDFDAGLKTLARGAGARASEMFTGLFSGGKSLLLGAKSGISATLFARGHAIKEGLGRMRGAGRDALQMGTDRVLKGPVKHRIDKRAKEMFGEEGAGVETFSEEQRLAAKADLRLAEEIDKGPLSSEDLVKAKKLKQDIDGLKGWLSNLEAGKPGGKPSDLTRILSGEQTVLDQRKQQGIKQMEAVRKEDTAEWSPEELDADLATFEGRQIFGEVRKKESDLTRQIDDINVQLKKIKQDERTHDVDYSNSKEKLVSKKGELIKELTKEKVDRDRRASLASSIDKNETRQKGIRELQGALHGGQKVTPEQLRSVVEGFEEELVTFAVDTDRARVSRPDLSASEETENTQEAEAGFGVARGVAREREKVEDPAVDRFLKVDHTKIPVSFAQKLVQSLERRISLDKQIKQLEGEPGSTEKLNELRKVKRKIVLLKDKDGPTVTQIKEKLSKDVEQMYDSTQDESEAGILVALQERLNKLP